MPYKQGYQGFIERYFSIVNKQMQMVPFKLNKIQNQYLNVDGTSKRDVILKARQQGFSSVILAVFTTDFLVKENSRSVIVADEKENAQELLDRVRFFIECYEEKKGIKIPMKYDSKYELYNEAMKSRYSIGTAQRTEFGRSKTISNLHMSEVAFYPNMDKLLAGALQAVSPTGRVILETTANGFNPFKEFWTRSERGETNFKPLFYAASDYYDKEFLKDKERELDRMYKQEYPETPIEAFISSGDCYFNKESLAWYLKNIKTAKKFLAGGEVY